MARVLAFTGIPGTEIRQAVRRLALAVDSGSEPVSIDQAVWDCFREDAQKDDRLRARADLEPKDLDEVRPNWFGFLALPKGAVRKYWQKGARRVLDEVSGRKDGLVFLSFHAVYQADAYRWRYSAVDIQLLAEFGVSDFFCLIDDVYDIQRRRPADSLSEVAMCDGTDDASRRAAKLVEITVDRLDELVRWRQEEIHVTELLAASLGGTSHVVALKHPLESVKKVVLAPGDSWYLSHPITNLRKDSSFPDLDGVREVNAVAAELRAMVPLIEPTSIDERRLVMLDDSTFSPALGPRWPLLVSESELLLHSGGQTTELQSILCWPSVEKLEIVAEVEGLMKGEGEPGSKKVVGEACTRLVARIDEDITWRDHTLVDQTGRLFVYRPAYQGKLSTGVQREMTYLSKLGVVRPDGENSVVLHPAVDKVSYHRAAASAIVRAVFADATVSGRLARKPSKGVIEELQAAVASVLGAGTDERSTVDGITQAILGHSRIQPSVVAELPMQRGKRSAALRAREALRRAVEAVVAANLGTAAWLRFPGIDIVWKMVEEDRALDTLLGLGGENVHR